MRSLFALLISLQTWNVHQLVYAQHAVPGTNALQFFWANNQADIHMVPRSTHMCFLTGLSGDLDEDGSVVVHGSSTDVRLAATILLLAQTGGNTEWDDNSDVWKLGGWQIRGRDLSGEAVCVPMSNFLMDPGGFTEVSGPGHVWITTPAGFDCDLRRVETDMWPSETATFITGARGAFYGFSESVYVKLASNPFEPAKLGLTIDNCDVFKFEGSGRSYRAGVFNSGRFPNYSAFMTDKLRVDGNRGERWLAPTRDAVCGFTYIGGDIHGFGEFARIVVNDFQGVPWWKLQVGSGNGKVEASAACLSYDQRTVPVVGPD